MSKLDPALLEKLIKEYQSTIPQKMSLLRDLMNKIRLNLSEVTVKDLRFQIHKLAGNAGTYGYWEVSDLCKEFEIELLKKIEDLKLNKSDPKWVPLFECYLNKIERGFTHAE